MFSGLCSETITAKTVIATIAAAAATATLIATASLPTAIRTHVTLKIPAAAARSTAVIAIPRIAAIPDLIATTPALNLALAPAPAPDLRVVRTKSFNKILDNNIFKLNILLPISNYGI